MRVAECRPARHGAAALCIRYPPADGFANIIQAGKWVIVQQLISQRAIGSLDEDILVRLAGLDVLDRDARLLCPTYECLPRKPGAFSGVQHLRAPSES